MSLGSPSSADLTDRPPRSDPGGPTGARRRWLLLAAAVVVAVVATVAVVANRPEAGPVPVGGADPSASVAGEWLSGASGTGAANHALGTWRGRPLEVAGTWADNNEAMVALPQLRPGAEFGSWTGPIDIAIGGIGEGETWNAAAGGAYDARWRTSLTNLQKLWGSRPGTVYIRFAHEMNGNWYPWAVNDGNYRDFLAAWKRFRVLQQQVFPAAKLVFCLTRQSVNNGMDWRKAFPGAQYVDVLGVDYYNNAPVTNTVADWKRTAAAVDRYGAPEGIEQYLAFAQKSGLPLAVPEWSGNADEADSTAFITGMYDFFRTHAGTGPGKVLYEILFNVEGGDNKFVLFGSSRMPQSAAAYQRLW